MRWQINHDLTQESTGSEEQRITAIINAILQSRGLADAHQIKDFLEIASPSSYTPADVGIDASQLSRAVSLINQAVTDQQPIIVYGDYDADGITATAILWETLHHSGAKAVPFIPSREHHGYGLSVKGLEDALKLVDSNPLVITVDNGIVAHQPAQWLKDNAIPLIITDHHAPGDQLPHAESIIHSTKIAGAGVAWFVSKELSEKFAASTLDLVAVGTIADMMPLLGINRSFAKHGLDELGKSHRPGLEALLKQASVDLSQNLTPYHINYIIAPRLNAMGRLEHAIDSLRLVCTRNPQRAAILAEKLGATNRTRQDLTVDLLAQAIGQIDAKALGPIIIVEDEAFHEGIIGLIAGKLVETFYRPAIVISKKADVSKASARSIKGINITELIRSQSDLLLGVGGHPMAAGFSIETGKIDSFKQSLIQHAATAFDSSIFEPSLDIDTAINETDICEDLYSSLKTLQPFGIGNKEPVFAINKVKVISIQPIGKNGGHRKIKIERSNSLPLEAVWFNPPVDFDQIKSGTICDIAATISMNTWKNKSTLQLVIKDIVSNFI
jgi:single-stranded-DNA-specific exonuclease